MRTRFSLAAMLAVMAPLTAIAETSTDPVGDLATITLKADANFQLGNFLGLLREQKYSPENLRREVEKHLFDSYPDGYTRGDGPVYYRIVGLLENAQIRARYYQGILETDLNGDGSISRQEVTDALKVKRVIDAAEAFFLADDDGNGILSPGEIRAAVLRTTDRFLDYPDGVPSLIATFDFDDDGVVTPPERDRALAALAILAK